MRQVIISGTNQFELTDQPTPLPRAGELLIAPLRVGICATDLELLDGSMVYLRNGMATLPLVPGHEWVGVVVRTGEAVEEFRRGDLVVGECSVGCGECALCARGDYHQCPDRTETGIMGRTGGMSQFIRFPARAAHAVPPNVPLEDAALIEPTAVAYRAILRLAPVRGETALVVGGGTLGYLSAALLVAEFGMEVRYSAHRRESRERLEQLGCRPVREGERFRFIMEAAGTVEGLETAINRLDSGGRVVLIGLTGESSVPMPVDDVVVKDQEIVGSLGSPRVWDDVVRTVAAGTVRPGALVSTTFDIEDYGHALALLAERNPATGKVLVAPHRSADTALAIAG